MEKYGVWLKVIISRMQKMEEKPQIYNHWNSITPPVYI